ncbi:hypothetical protein DFO45_1939 [Azorhizobium sp. AG788]|uniref:hypothetical protein n=1 Tax=Azorhizobium sp. AG788 TaxID=2183897 RepID=UPI00105F5804|nr:hypothetical protein [Azorhizobium sp. AG788]TDT96741.1 hypothetical protein DFO45_1939 [Azorhizobium sp. AG788]
MARAAGRFGNTSRSGPRLGALLTLLVPAAAGAAPPAEAPNVVIIAVAAVQEPDGATDCTEKGQVRQVEKGTRLAIGQNVTLTVPCRRAGAKARSGTPDSATLSAAPYGRVQLDTTGTLLRAPYEPLADAPPPPPSE